VLSDGACRAGACFFFILGKLWFWRPFFKIFGKMSIFKKKVITCNAQFAHMEAPGLGACVF
jgi:hypothetical protein